MAVGPAAWICRGCRGFRAINRIAGPAGNGQQSAMSTPLRYPLIFNPKARSQRGRRALRFLQGKAASVDLFATGHEDEARELAARFAAAGEPVVIAAGGDGTLNAVVRGLAGSNTALAVLPTGTMNVFARELGIPFGNLAKAFEVIERGFVREVDLFEANKVPFVQMAGVGFDAKVIEATSWASKKALGPLDLCRWPARDRGGGVGGQWHVVRRAVQVFPQGGQPGLDA